MGSQATGTKALSPEFRYLLLTVGVRVILGCVSLTGIATGAAIKHFRTTVLGLENEL